MPYFSLAVRTKPPIVINSINTLLNRIAQRPLHAMLAITALMLLLSIGRLGLDNPQAGMETTNTWWPIINGLQDGEGFISCFSQYFPFCGPENNTSAAREPIPSLLHAGVGLITGRSLWAAVCVHLLIGIAVAWLLFLLGQRWASTRVGVLAALCWSIYLPIYQMLPQVGGDHFALLFSLIALLLMQNAFDKSTPKKWLLLGLLVGIAMLCRSTLMAYIPAIGLAILLSPGEIKQKTSRILLIAVGLIVVLAPWSIRNHNALGTWSFGSTLSGYNVLRHNSVLSQEDIYQYVGPDEAHELVLDLIDDHAELSGLENEKEMNSLYMKAGLESIRSHPWNYIKLSFYRLFVLWTNWKVSDSSNRASGIEDHAMSIQQVIFLLLGLLSLRIRTGFERAIVFTIFFYCALHMGVVCRIRYLLPLMPILLLFVGRTLDRWITPIKV